MTPLLSRYNNYCAYAHADQLYLHTLVWMCVATPACHMHRDKIPLICFDVHTVPLH